MFTLYIRQLIQVNERKMPQQRTVTFIAMYEGLNCKTNTSYIVLNCLKCRVLLCVCKFQLLFCFKATALLRLCFKSSCTNVELQINSYTAIFSRRLL